MALMELFIEGAVDLALSSGPLYLVFQRYLKNWSSARRFYGKECSELVQKRIGDRFSQPVGFGRSQMLAGAPHSFSHAPHMANSASSAKQSGGGTPRQA